MRNSTSHCDSRRSWPGGGGVLGGREVEKRKEVGSLGEPYLHVATRLREKEKLGRRVIQMYNNGFYRD